MSRFGAFISAGFRSVTGLRSGRVRTAFGGHPVGRLVPCQAHVGRNGLGPVPSGRRLDPGFARHDVSTFREGRKAPVSPVAEAAGLAVAPELPV